MPTYRVLEPMQGRAALQRWKRALLHNVLLVVGALGFTFGGLVLLESPANSLSDRIFNAAWNAANTVTTLGDLQQLNHDQKLFMIAAMFVAASIVTYALSTLGGVLSSPDIAEYRENKRMHRVLSELKNHVIVVGYSDVGLRVADRLRASGKKVVVIESNPLQAEQASQAGYLVVQGQASQEQTQRHAGVEHAEAFLVTSLEAEQRVATTLIARALNHALYISAVGSSDVGKDWLTHAGATDVILVNEIIAANVVTRLGQRVRLNTSVVKEAAADIQVAAQVAERAVKVGDGTAHPMKDGL